MSRGRALDMEVIQSIRQGAEPRFPELPLALPPGTHLEHKHQLSSLWGHRINKRHLIDCAIDSLYHKATPWG